MDHGHSANETSTEYSQACDCGAIRLRESGKRTWEPWHVCGLCALSQAHADKHERAEARNGTR